MNEQKKYQPRKIVYIAHPLGQTERQANREAASRWVRFAANMGYAPAADWIILSMVDDLLYGGNEQPEVRAVGLACDFALIHRCDEVWLCGPVVSPGMQLERDFAQSHGIPVRNFTGKTEETVRMQLESHADTLPTFVVPEVAR